MKKIIIFVFLLGSAYWLNAMEPMKQRLEMKIDPVGNAVFHVNMTMNASQWQVWLQSVGNNPAVLKRTMERALPAYFLSDFRLERDDMARTFEFSFKAYGVCQVNRRGRWLVNLDKKDAEVTTLSDRKYMMVSMDVPNNLQQTQIIEFPPEANNIAISRDAFGRTQFEFDMEHREAGVNLLFIAGLLVFLSGGIWVVVRVRQA